MFLGILFLTCGILLLITASLHLRKAINTKDIVISGPFKYIRHPIYTSIYILSIGLGLIFFTWLWFIVMIIFIPFWYLECREEEKEMIKLYGKKYIEYQKKTGMFFPRMR
ncbi:MAG: isoprenylcysteine carboxylmethyltransferase family protein [Bacteroidales bacterium]|nr:isoprenylcysteine carboxylmethyltransferase family protein [Bacteroidales bacterium]